MDNSTEHIELSKTLLDTLTAAIHMWGADFQIERFEEELAEAQLAIAHHKRGRQSPDNVVEECADVIITALQAAMILGGTEGLTKLQGVIDEKTRRLSRRICLQRDRRPSWEPDGQDSWVLPVTLLSGARKVRLRVTQITQGVDEGRWIAALADFEGIHGPTWRSDPKETATDAIRQFVRRMREGSGRISEAAWRVSLIAPGEPKREGEE